MRLKAVSWRRRQWEHTRRRAVTQRRCLQSRRQWEHKVKIVSWRRRQWEHKAKGSTLARDTRQSHKGGVCSHECSGTHKAKGAASQHQLQLQLGRLTSQPSHLRPSPRFLVQNLISLVALSQRRIREMMQPCLICLPRVLAPPHLHRPLHHQRDDAAPV